MALLRSALVPRSIFPTNYFDRVSVLLGIRDRLVWILSARLFPSAAPWRQNVMMRRWLSSAPLSAARVSCWL
jgi:hypothetical protein